MSARTSLPWLLCFGVAVSLSLLWFGSVPLFGDEIGYGYSAASWIARNSLALVPAGAGRGEMGQGHPAMFLWFWALLMRVFGDSLATARILPTIAAGFGLLGTWRLGKELSGSDRVGVMAALGLLASPLFLAQAFRALPDTAHMAAIAWATVFYIRGRRLQSALLIVLATIFRQPGIILAPAFFLADLLRTRKARWGQLIWLLPLAVPLVNGLMHLSVNGFFIFPQYLAEGSPDLPANWIADRIRLFAGHLVGEDFRWFPISAALAFSFYRAGRKPGLGFMAALALPALLYPPSRLAVTAGFLLLSGVLVLLRKRPPRAAVTAQILFIGMIVAFHVLLVAVGRDHYLNLFRYILGTYPPLMALLATALQKAGKTVSSFIWILFCVASATCITAVRHPWQPDATVAGLLEARAVRSALASVENPVYPDGRIGSIPALGYVDEPQRTERHDVINLVLITADSHNSRALLPEGYVFTGNTSYRWGLGGLSVTAHEARLR
ncbi:MAG: glycosyltransferase family 39 protein [Candidatus Fermentibacteraceae bacterium]